MRGVAVAKRRLAALMLLPSSMVAKSPEVLPVQRWASSAMTRSNAGVAWSFCASAISGDDW